MKEIQETHQKKGIVSSDEYYTPKHIIEALGHFDLDPATPPNPRWRTADVMYTKEDDGLSKEWFGRVFLNPPYSRPLVGQFMEKMASHGNGIALVVPKLGSKMFRDVVYPSCSAIYILSERIKFYNENWEQQKSPICQSMLVAFGEENKEAIRNSGLKGIMLVPEMIKKGGTRMTEELFKNARQVYVSTIPSDVPPQEFKPTNKTLEDVLAMKALNDFTWQPPKDKEERKRLLEIINKGKIEHIITGRPKR